MWLRVARAYRGVIGLGLLLAVPTPAIAQEATLADQMVDRGERTNWAIGIAGSTLGIGPEATIRLHPNVIFRATGGTGNFGSLLSGLPIRTGVAYDTTFNPSGASFIISSAHTEYHVSRMKLLSARALVDLHPFRDGTRFSVGVAYLDVSGELSLNKPIAPVLVGDHTYTPAQVNGITVAYRNSGPLMAYTGLGFDTTYFKESSLSLSTDFGVLWGYRSSATLNGGAITASDRAKEEATLTSKLNQLSVFPVVSISTKYRF